jgi:glycosyltransferase involved in cell wall biosynthesis
MRILYLITRSEPGGAQSHLSSLVEHFSSEVVGVAAGLDEDNSLEGVTQRRGVEFVPIRHLIQPLNPLKDARAVLEIAGLMRRLKPDLVHIHSSKAGIVGRLGARLVGIPSVFTAHGWVFADGVSWKHKLVGVPSELAFGRLANHIITVSEADHRLTLRYKITDAKRVTVVHNGIEDTPHRLESSLGDEVRLVMVARFAPPKDHELLLRAIKNLQGSWRLLLIGDGPLRAQAERLAIDLGVADRVEFLGSRPDVPELLAGSDVFVLASNKEGLPISILEGMRAGLPVVASDVGGIPETVRDGENGFLVPRTDPVALRTALQKLIDDPALRQRFGQASRKRFERDFTAQRMFDQTRAIYESVLEMKYRRKS